MSTLHAPTCSEPPSSPPREGGAGCAHPRGQAHGAARLPDAGAAAPQPRGTGRAALGRVARGRGARVAPAGAQAPPRGAGRDGPRGPVAGRARADPSACDVSSSGRPSRAIPARAVGFDVPGSSRASRSAGRRSSTSGSRRPAGPAAVSTSRRSAAWHGRRWASGAGGTRSSWRIVGWRANRCRTRRPSSPSRRATSPATAPPPSLGMPSSGIWWRARQAASRAGRCRRWSGGSRRTGPPSELPADHRRVVRPGPDVRGQPHRTGRAVEGAGRGLEGRVCGGRAASS